MELSEIKEVKELLSKHDVNDFLKQGWVLLQVASGQEEDGGAYFLYVIGRK